MAKVLMAVAPERFRDEELFVTREELKQRGHTTSIASIRRGACQGSRGGTVVATVALSQVQASDYDAIVFVGGGGSRTLFADDDALRLAREADDQSRVVAAICLAPVLLANAGVLQGKRATVAGTLAKAKGERGAVHWARRDRGPERGHGQCPEGLATLRSEDRQAAEESEVERAVRVDQAHKAR